MRRPRRNHVEDWLIRRIDRQLARDHRRKFHRLFMKVPKKAA
jgi:hypothetical protein